MGLTALGTIEYVAESSYGVFPTNPTMLWIGALQEGSEWEIDTANEDTLALKAAGATNKLQPLGNVKTGQNMKFNWVYKPQDWNLFKRAISLTGGITETDTLSSLSFGLISADTKYATPAGGVIEEITVEIPEDRAAKVTAKGILGHVALTGNNPWSASDYIGAGAHASASAAAALGYKDISALTIGGVALVASDVKFGVKNTLAPVKDYNSTNTTNIKSVGVVKRDRFFSCTAKRSAISDHSVKLFGYGANDIVLTINGVSFTFANAKIPNEKYPFGTGGLSTTELNFSGITSVALSA